MLSINRITHRPLFVCTNELDRIACVEKVLFCFVFANVLQYELINT